MTLVEWIQKMRAFNVHKFQVNWISVDLYSTFIGDDTKM